ncbi:CaiB/BaiF CoA transferase family protein [Streptomyces lydicus]|uniref:CaiB/BaiF CoA transferase family protein n=1 Tax=Streptomyces lydicus TaxID=47763 RepID=UPI00341B7BD0
MTHFLTADAATSGSQAVLPLAGVRVIDLSQIGAGPYGASMLGDLGADVVKVEPPGGESFRYVDNLFGPGDSAYFYGVNRSKRSLALDLQTPEGHAVLERLVTTADVLIVGFRPDAVDKLGIGYEALAQLNEQLIYCSITAFGEDGPRAHQPGMDILGQALGGLMGLTGEPEGSPVKAGVPIADFVVSFLLGFGVCAALRGREQNGRGQKLSFNLLDGQIATLANFLTHYERTRTPIRPQGGGHPQLAPYQPFLGSDETFFIVACLNDRFWRRLTEAINRPDLAADPRFESNPDRVAHREQLTDLLSEVFAEAPSGHWLARLEESGVPCSPINRLEDVFKDPQVTHNGSIIQLRHPVHGGYPVPNLPIRFHGTPAQPRGYAPRLGEHSREVLESSGFSPEEVDRLLAQGVVLEGPVS